ncbi:MAG: biotin/lipoyl-containing protein [Dehalococcoidia bacterium]
MATFTMPQLGESDVEGTVLRWLKRPGERVRQDEPLVEVETEKVNVEIPSPFEGTLTDVLVQEGETVPVGAALAVIGEAGATPVPAFTGGNGAATPAVPSAPAPVPAPDSAVAPAASAAAPTARPAPAPPPGPAASPNGARSGRYSPAVLRLASEHQIDLARVPGAGLDGRVTRKDVLRYLEAAAATTEVATAGVVPPPDAATAPAPSDEPRRRRAGDARGPTAHGARSPGGRGGRSRRGGDQAECDASDYRPQHGPLGADGPDGLDGGGGRCHGSGAAARARA